MSRANKSDRTPIQRLTDFLAEDDLSISDEELLREFKESGGDPDRLAADMRSLFEATVLKSNKGKLAAAKAGAAAVRQRSSSQESITPSEARRRLRELVRNPAIPSGLTLAARNEGELSDSDVLGMLDDLRELGFLSEDDAS